uniref:HTH merR-type domain-containing protein n=1 Tax=Tolypothrix bouteillei VB521301 TaxID=1479485 RepID=A0A0C1RP65_9CYAN
MELYTKAEVADILGLSVSGFWRVAEECGFSPAIQKNKMTALYTPEQVDEMKIIYALKRKGIQPALARALMKNGLDRLVWVLKDYKTAKIIDNPDELLSILNAKGKHEVERVNLKELAQI